MKNIKNTLEANRTIAEFLGYTYVEEKYGDIVVEKDGRVQFCPYYDQPDETYILWFELQDKYGVDFGFEVHGKEARIKSNTSNFDALLRYRSASQNMFGCILHFINYMNYERIEL